MPWRLLIAVGLAALLQFGCDAINMEDLHPGESTVEDVERVMGPPSMRWQSSDGTQTIEYTRMPYGVVNYMMDFDASRVLREVRQVLTAENFARVKAGMDRDGIRRLLGKPAHEYFFSLKREYVWDWNTSNDPANEQSFNVHFDENGRVTRTSTSFNNRH